MLENQKFLEDKNLNSKNLNFCGNDNAMQTWIIDIAFQKVTEVLYSLSGFAVEDAPGQATHENHIAFPFNSDRVLCEFTELLNLEENLPFGLAGINGFEHKIIKIVNFKMKMFI